MKILVCVKQVPDMESAFQVNPQGSDYEEEGLIFRVNTYDETAIEEAVLIKEARDDVQITALSVGPHRVRQALRRALEFGVDRGVHIPVAAGQVLNPLQIASMIAAFVRKEPFALILFGVMSEDLQQYQTGPTFAALMGLPWATTVIAESIRNQETRVRVERELEGGRREIIELPQPAVLTVQSGINIPRYPSLSNKLRARKQELETFSLDD